MSLRPSTTLRPMTRILLEQTVEDLMLANSSFVKKEDVVRLGVVITEALEKDRQANGAVTLATLTCATLNHLVAMYEAHQR